MSFAHGSFLHNEALRTARARLGKSTCRGLMHASYPGRRRERDASAACAPKDFDGAKFTVCTFDPRHDNIRLFFTGTDGKPYGSLSALACGAKGEGRKAYVRDERWHVQQDQSRRPLCRGQPQAARGRHARRCNEFHMKPNGVFWIGDGVAGVTETSRYLANTPPARYATQSGPMLIVDGKIHPKIRPNGTSRRSAMASAHAMGTRSPSPSPTNRSPSTPSPGCSAMGSAVRTRLPRRLGVVALRPELSATMTGADRPIVGVVQRGAGGGR